MAMNVVRRNGMVVMLLALATVGSMTWSAHAVTCEGTLEDSCGGVLHTCVSCVLGCCNCTYTEKNGCGEVEQCVDDDGNDLFCPTSTPGASDPPSDPPTAAPTTAAPTAAPTTAAPTTAAPTTAAPTCENCTNSTTGNVTSPTPESGAVSRGAFTGALVVVAAVFSAMFY
eukprot:CAMPEP_0118921178 /NCGR_PEP_ID=MMETSP1169-20130426/539_1 /TAXON_ID=36882 /ORGANISM="Pyramimonas obovata, Strain CCMP722" /LENGTH=169 /DNA_ID=CAMNT_0006861859 /DNA_START=140 /DNA_END=649 /DNA_ORIENTATION=+